MSKAQEPIEFIAGNVKAAMAEAGAKSSDLWKVPRDRIRVVPGFNVRNADDPEYIAHVQAIAASIEENGFYPDRPLAGYVGKEDDEDVLYVTDGHSRLAAVDLLIAKGIEIGTLPVVVKPRGTSMEDLTVALVTSNTGKPLTPYEIGVVCKRLVGYGMDEKVIAKRLGITKRYVDDLLSLVGAPKAVRDLVVRGKVSSTMAIQAMRDHGADAAKKLTAAVKTATEAGKEKATAKHMRKPAEKGEPTHVKVSIADLKKWRDEWISLNDPGDGTDCVTPFDHYLYGPIKGKRADEEEL